MLLSDEGQVFPTPGGDSFVLVEYQPNSITVRGKLGLDGSERQQFETTGGVAGVLRDGIAISAGGRVFVRGRDGDVAS